MPRGQYIIDMKGQVFGALTVLAKADTHKLGTYWICKCECGAIKTVRRDHLVKGKIRSCGCISKSMRLDTRGAATRSLHPLYGRWISMVQRCYLPSHTSYPRYGALGVQVCDRWRFGENGKEAFHCFLEDMGDIPFPGASIDRLDSQGHYEPSNCRWANVLEQARNRRSNRLSDKDVAQIKRRLHSGESGSTLARELGVSQSLISHIRLSKCWADVDAAS